MMYGSRNQYTSKNKYKINWRKQFNTSDRSVNLTDNFMNMKNLNPLKSYLEYFLNHFLWYLFSKSRASHTPLADSGHSNSNDSLKISPERKAIIRSLITKDFDFKFDSGKVRRLKNWREFAKIPSSIQIMDRHEEIVHVSICKYQSL